MSACEAPLATIEDLEARWKPLPDSDRERARVLIEDASAAIEALLPPGRRPGAAALRLVCCNVVRRAMGPNPLGEGAPDLKQMTETAGSYSVSATFANPTGDMFLTSTEQQLLGIRGSASYEVLPDIGYGGERWGC